VAATPASTGQTLARYPAAGRLKANCRISWTCPVPEEARDQVANDPADRLLAELLWQAERSLAEPRRIFSTIDPLAAVVQAKVI
jgi:hypothetical protein